LRTGGLVDIKQIKEKRGSEIVRNMNNNFAKETNQRDEDAEMQKFIEEQLKLKKEAEKLKQVKSEAPDAENSNFINASLKYKRPEDALFDVPKYLIESASKNRSEESLSEQMLSGIPEVDLGIEERIRNIEETEKAKQRLFQSRISTNPEARINSMNLATPLSSEENSKQALHYAPHATSMSYVQHKRFDDALINPDHMIKPRVTHRKDTSNLDSQPVVGNAPKHELLQQNFNQYSSLPSFKRPHNVKNNTHKRRFHTSVSTNERQDTSGGSNNPPKRINSSLLTSEKASDDYCLERFKKSMRHSRNSRIKIA
jgi:hypothetical protein